jgi:NAD(P)-dependent dehydrogenase (short-subunit alcohol dehydrogenase family)
MVFATPGVRQAAPPELWREHLFGLTLARWEALAGHSWWVTGAGTGFGQAIAVALALSGARVFLSGRRADKLATTGEWAASLGAPRDHCVALPCDITDDAQIEEAPRRIGALGGKLRGLVHCAALPNPGGSPWPLQALPLAQWEALMRLNVTAPWLLTRAAMAHMVPNGTARVVLLSSEAGWAWTPTVGPYNVSKAALNNLGMSLAGEYAASHPDCDTQINVLVPGEARTEMNQGSTDSPFSAVSMTLMLLSHPTGGPNGHFFHRDGRHLAFAHRLPYHEPL